MMLLYFTYGFLVNDGLMPPNAVLPLEEVAFAMKLDLAAKRFELATIFVEPIGPLLILLPSLAVIGAPLSIAPLKLLTDGFLVAAMTGKVEPLVLVVKAPLACTVDGNLPC